MVLRRTLLPMGKLKTKQKTLTPEFVELIPDVLKEGVLYISIPYATASHKCACGCGRLVVTPIKPTDWSLTWNGETVTLNPSIGSWNLPCQSHYWIIDNKVRWARKWSVREIEKNRIEDQHARNRYYNRLT